MSKEKAKAVYNFSDREFPEVALNKCSITEFNPSQTEVFTSTSNYSIIIVKDGKGIVTHSDRRYALTKGNGVVLSHSDSAKFKADSIEPFSLIEIQFGGRSAESIISSIERREKSPVLNFLSNFKIVDSAFDLIVECSKTYHTDYSILLTFYDFINSINEHYMDKKVPTKNVYMTRAVEYIKQNFNKNISVEQIANLLGIERSYLSRLFKTYKNKSTQNYIIDYRMYKAKRLFEEEDMNVSQVCAAVGYTNIYCFSRIFKSRVGMPPKEYMEQCRKKIIS